MKILAQSLCGLLLSMPRAAQNHMPTQSRVVGLVPSLGDLHHLVSTHNPEAQKFFDQGKSEVTASPSCLGRQSLSP